MSQEKPRELNQEEIKDWMEKNPVKRSPKNQEKVDESRKRLNEVLNIFGLPLLFGSNKPKNDEDK